MIREKNKILMLFCCFFFTFSNLVSYAQSTIYKIEINPLNRVLFYFDKLPNEYFSQLSLDKKKITIKIKNCTIVDSAKRAKGTGIIQDVYTSINKNQTELNIFLKDKRGYTAVPLPYSQTLMVECFQWDNLTNGEDIYRETLLAIENKINIGIQDSLLKAATLGDANSLTFLSFILLQKGYVKSSHKALTIANEKGSNIPDMYAALSQTYKLLGDEKKINQVNTLFYNATGLINFLEIAIPENLSNIQLADDSLFHILNEMGFSANSQNKSDSLIIFNQKDSSEIKKDTSSFLKNLEDESATPSWLSDFVLYFIILFLLMSIFIISSYFKWRKQQIKNRTKQKNENSKFVKDFEKAKQTVNQGKIIDKTINEEINIPKSQSPSINKKEEINFEDKLEKLAQKLVDSKKQSIEYQADIETISTIKEPVKKKIPPKIELALHLQNEQQRLKQQSIESLKGISLESNREKLIEIAQKLRLEKSSVETQQKLEELKQNEQSFSKLKDKFSVINNKK